MSVQIRLTRQLYDQVRADLSRPHPFAAERVGFLFGRMGNATTAAPLILLNGYEPLANERYINDRSSGARIDSHSIRGAMQQVLNRRMGAFHVHLHEWPGTPRFSPMDCEELPRVVSGFRNVDPALAHGMFLLSNDQCAAWVWLPGSKQPIEAAQIGIVGYPIQLFNAGE